METDKAGRGRPGPSLCTRGVENCLEWADLVMKLISELCMREPFKSLGSVSALVPKSFNSQSFPARVISLTIMSGKPCGTLAKFIVWSCKIAGRHRTLMGAYGE